DAFFAVVSEEGAQLCRNNESHSPLACSVLKHSEDLRMLTNGDCAQAWAVAHRPQRYEACTWRVNDEAEHRNVDSIRCASRDCLVPSELRVTYAFPHADDEHGACIE